MGRRLCTTEQFIADGGTWDQLRSLVAVGLYCRVVHGVYADAPGDASVFEKALGRMLHRREPAWGTVAAVMHGFDGVEATEQLPRRRSSLVDGSVSLVDGHACTSPLQTLIDIAPMVSDDVWEQALEFTLRKKLVSLGELLGIVPSLSKSRVHGVRRMRRVLAARPLGAQPTESRLETLFIQAARLVPDLPPPVRQYRVVNRHGSFVARVDLCWPDLGIFVELDGQHHKDQPVYDAARETAVVAATGWLCGRFTWRQVARTPRTSARQLAELVDQARLRPVARAAAP